MLATRLSIRTLRVAKLDHYHVLTSCDALASSKRYRCVGKTTEGLPKLVDETLIPLRALLLELLSFDQIYHHTHHCASHAHVNGLFHHMADRIQIFRQKTTNSAEIPWTHVMGFTCEKIMVSYGTSEGGTVGLGVIW
jgi:hypothetical protein